MTVEEIGDSEQVGDGTGGADGSGAAANSESIDRLQGDVDLLGDLLGEVLREQGDPGLFEAVEHLRRDETGGSGHAAPGARAGARPGIARCRAPAPARGPGRRRRPDLPAGGAAFSQERRAGSPTPGSVLPGADPALRSG